MRAEDPVEGELSKGPVSVEDPVVEMEADQAGAAGAKEDG
jgi:hypothetical protein